MGRVDGSFEDLGTRMKQTASIRRITRETTVPTDQTNWNLPIGLFIRTIDRTCARACF